MKIVLSIVILLIGVLIGYFIFYSKCPDYNEDTNSRLMYGETGLPKNCRAIIKTNYEGWYLNQYTADAALDSINRNCGELGYSWDIEK